MDFRAWRSGGEHHARVFIDNGDVGCDSELRSGCREAAALVHFSKDGEPSDLVKIGFCVGIINGISYTGVPSGLCVPVGVTAQQAVGVVVQYIDGQAITRTDEDLRLLAFEVLHAVWPCKN